MYIDFLNKIKNAQAARKDTLRVPYTKADFAIAEMLLRRNFLKGVSKKGKGVKKILEAQLNYEKSGEGAIRGVKFLSKPSRRLYVGYKELKPVKHGFGMVVLSTPKGILSGNVARREKVGGELLFEIW